MERVERVLRVAEVVLVVSLLLLVYRLPQGLLILLPLVRAGMEGLLLEERLLGLV